MGEDVKLRLAEAKTLFGENWPKEGRVTEQRSLIKDEEAAGGGGRATEEEEAPGPCWSWSRSNTDGSDLGASRAAYRTATQHLEGQRQAW